MDDRVTDDRTSPSPVASASAPRSSRGYGPFIATVFLDAFLVVTFIIVRFFDNGLSSLTIMLFFGVVASLLIALVVLVACLLLVKQPRTQPDYLANAFIALSIYVFLVILACSSPGAGGHNYH